jgi:hypothetical protein
MAASNSTLLIDITGQCFGRLVAVRRDGSDRRGQPLWLCKCDCGGITRTRGQQLRCGKARSCGCMRVIKTKERHAQNHPDIAGQRFGRLTVLRRAPTMRNLICWICECDCGNFREIPGSDLRAGKRRSCGCVAAEALLRNRRMIRHGESGKERITAEYRCWGHIKARCTNLKFPHYKHCGGRGITVCERWFNSYENFLADMGRKPSPLHSIDRIDNDRGYEPGNCRWATAIEHRANRRPQKAGGRDVSTN